MVATGFTQYTGLPGHDPATAGFLPPRDVPNAGAITVQPPQGETRRLVGEPVAEAPDGRDAPGEEVVWDPEPDERFGFASLLSCGKGSEVVDVMGHAVGVESLNVDDDLLIGTFTKDYLGTESYARAVQLATCAAGVRTVDGQPLYQPLSPNEPKKTAFDARLTILRQYHSSVIMGIYPHILNLDVEFGALLEKLGK